MTPTAIVVFCVTFLSAAVCVIPPLPFEPVTSLPPVPPGVFPVPEPPIPVPEPLGMPVVG